MHWLSSINKLTWLCNLLCIQLDIIFLAFFLRSTAVRSKSTNVLVSFFIYVWVAIVVASAKRESIHIFQIRTQSFACSSSKCAFNSVFSEEWAFNLFAIYSFKCATDFWLNFQCVFCAFYFRSYNNIMPSLLQIDCVNIW